MTTSIDNPYLLRDEYIDSRNIQDHHLNAELASIRTFIQACFDATEKKLIRRIDDSDAKHEQKMAYIRNQNLRNPNLPIEPIVSLRDEGLVLPNPTRFPKHAKQFYALRKPDTLLRVRMLGYLVGFYDIQWQRWEVLGGDDDADDYETYADEDKDEDAATATRPPKLSLWDAVQTYPEFAVNALESILGLNEQNFINFRECAKLKSPPQATKRRQLLAPRVESHSTQSTGSLSGVGRS
ncbi:wac domain-containing protein [Colletotrichum incanum]|uniref:Wac domain-containing protein n=1 Tax=Colletotrichum incanum TaxID=1573173 RepID=A0A167EBA8_COLIC|nr:wac domain-containing protein [Colletotrichum incanum]